MVDKDVRLKSIDFACNTFPCPDFPFRLFLQAYYFILFQPSCVTCLKLMFSMQELDLKIASYFYKSFFKTLLTM